LHPLSVYSGKGFFLFTFNPNFEMAKKDAYYFSHDANAQDDPKCMLLIDQMGMEGYGIFWALIERLRAEKDYTLPLNICNAFAKRWGTSREKVETVIKSYGLFLVENEKFFSQRLQNSMIEKSEKARQSANYRWQNANALLLDSGGNANGMRNDANKGKEKKEKEKKRGVEFFADNTKVKFPDGSSQKLGNDQIDLLSRSQLKPRDVFKGIIY
jgi:Domain of unknown function (DUF4373)